MKGLLKCYYGYCNRGDELLFMGLVPYLFDYYSDLTYLDVEVGDVNWMIQWCELNPDRWNMYRNKVRFVPSRTFSMWVADYDIIFAGGGEVLAARTRSWWHGGVNYLVLFWRWIWTGRMVRLGGIETPYAWWSKLLYRMILPLARQIICREQGSYDIAKRYTDKAILYHDWAIDVLGKRETENKFKDMKINLKTGKYRQYVMINSIPKHMTSEIIAQFHEWIVQYPDHQVINFPAEKGDILPVELADKYADRIVTYKRWEHNVSQTLSLFKFADAGFGMRLHFIIPCLCVGTSYYPLIYSEKISKIITSYFEL